MGPYDIAHDTMDDAEELGFCREPDCEGETFWCEACEKMICSACDHWHRPLEGRDDE